MTIDLGKRYLPHPSIVFLIKRVKKFKKSEKKKQKYS